MNSNLKVNYLEYYSTDQKLGFLAFFTIGSGPYIIEVCGLIKYVGKNRNKETFDEEDSAYNKVLEELSRKLLKHALASRKTQLILSLDGSPIHLNTYDSELAEILTKETESIVEKYLYH